MNLPKAVLMIDNDLAATCSLERHLTKAGFNVFVARGGHYGLSLAQVHQPDVVLLDINLPDMDGWQVCQQIRRNSIAPIIIISHEQNAANRVLGLELGADDYMVKPVSYPELLARIKAIFRRMALARFDSNPQIQIGDVCLDPAAYRVFKRNRVLTLRQKEFDLLYTLMSRPGQVISRAELMDQVWGVDWLGDTRTLDVHIRWVREKIEEYPNQPEYIQTVRGVGYRFVSPGEVDM